MQFGSDEDVETVVKCTRELAEIWNRYTKLYKTNVPLRAFVMVLADGACKQPKPMSAVEDVCRSLRSVTTEMLTYDGEKQ